MTDSPLARYLVPVRRWWWVVVAVLVVGLALTALTMPDRRPMTEEEIAAEATSFRATHLLIRNGEAPSQLTFELIDLLANQGDLTNRVAERLGEDVDPADVQTMGLTTDPVTETIAITAVRPTAEEAGRWATTFADELVTFLDERTLSTIQNDLQRVTDRLGELESTVAELQDEVEDLPEGDAERGLEEAELASLLQEYSQLRTQQRSLADQSEGLAASFVTLEEPSPLPVQEDAELLALPARPLVRFGVVTILALLVGVALTFGIDRLDTRIRTRRDAEEAFGLPVVAELPHRSRRALQSQPLPTFTDPGGVTAEVIRALRLSLSLAPTWHLTSLSRDGDGAVGTKAAIPLGRDPRSLVITSTLTGDGKSTLAANLAVSLAESGKRVLVVDCDFRRPVVGKLLEVDPGIGLRELAHVAERPLLDLAVPTAVPNVAMVRSGSRGVTPPWFMRDVGALVRRCEDLADVVIFDTGPITLTNEASALLPHVDTGLVVARSGKVATDQARGAVEQLTQVSARVTGVVLVGSETRRRYGYGYYAAKDTEGVETGPAQPVEVSQTPRSLWNTNRPPDGPGQGRPGTGSSGNPTELPTESPGKRASM